MFVIHLLPLLTKLTRKLSSIEDRGQTNRVLTLDL